MEINEIRKQLIDKHESFCSMINELNDSEVIFSSNGKWNSLQHAIHITKSIKTINLSFNLPKFLLKLLFGMTKKSSKNYEDLCKTYDLKLLAGAKADLIYHPKSDIKAYERIIILQKLKQAVRNNIQSMSNFSDTELDEFQLPHPILGKITLKEMLYFILYHVECHQKSIKKMLNK